MKLISYLFWMIFNNIEASFICAPKWSGFLTDCEFKTLIFIYWFEKNVSLSFYINIWVLITVNASESVTHTLKIFGFFWKHLHI